LSISIRAAPIPLCTEGPLIFQTSLSQELDLLIEQGEFTRDEAEELALDGLEYSFSR
jgi:adenosine deaminase